MQKTHILVLDSKDRLNYETSNSNDCRLFVSPSVGGFNKFELLSFSLPLTQYNVTTDNNQIYFNISGTNYTATITPTSYNTCTLPLEIKRAMEAIAVGNTFDVWYDSGLFKLVFTITSGGS